MANDFVIFVLCSMVLSVFWVAVADFWKANRTRKRTDVAAPIELATVHESEKRPDSDVNREVAQIVADQTKLIELEKRAHMKYVDQDTITKWSSVAIAKANPQLLLKALKRASAEANLMRSESPKLVWPQATRRMGEQSKNNGDL